MRKIRRLKKIKKSIDNYENKGYTILASPMRDKANGILAQLGEHLPYKQRVTGSSPVGPIYIYSLSDRYMAE